MRTGCVEPVPFGLLCAGMRVEDLNPGHSESADRARTVTAILQDEDGQAGRTAGELLPLVYEELRALATHRMAREGGPRTLQPTALVHEAYLRLLGPEDRTRPMWDGRGHFFAAAAEAMRRILIERARRRLAAKHGGGKAALPLDGEPAEAELRESQSLLELDAAFGRFEAADPAKAALVKLRYFGGLSEEQAAEALGISRATASRHWAYARAWLCDAVKQSRAQSG